MILDYLMISNSLEIKIKNLPCSCGIYQFKDKKGNIIYVGKAKNLRNRVRSYFSSKAMSPMTSKMVTLINDVDIIKTDSEVESLILEMNLIKKLKPRYNVNLKDDKSYPYITITKELFPRVFTTRKRISDGSKYFGPYTDVGSVKYSLKMLRDIFMIRTCSLNITEEAIRNRKFKVCLEYHIKKCGGPCEGLVSAESYREMIREVEKVLNGKTSTLINELKQKMKEQAEKEDFEEAAILRNKISALEVYSEKQKIVSEDMTDRDIINYATDNDDACAMILNIRDGRVIGKRHYYLSSVENKDTTEILENVIYKYYSDNNFIPEEIYLPDDMNEIDIISEWFRKNFGKSLNIITPKRGGKVQLLNLVKTNARYMLDELNIQRLKKEFVPDTLYSLKRDLKLPKLPKRIECFDISNIQGTDTVASMVVFENAKPRKSHYRKFKIKSVSGLAGRPDDFAAMREVIHRRYSRKFSVQEDETNDMPLPDLIVVDGGKGQLNSALRVLKDIHLEKLSVIGLAKRLEEIYIPGSSEPQSIPKSSSGLRLLQRIRDEAHRFAVTFHRKLRENRTIRSELENIKGIGKIKAARLLKEFGSVENIRNEIVNNYSEFEKRAGVKTSILLKQYFSIE